MVDFATIVGSHALLLFAAWRLLWRDDLDRDTATSHSVRQRPWLRSRDVTGEDHSGA